jgi:hypothetical protein
MMEQYQHILPLYLGPHHTTAPDVLCQRPWRRRLLSWKPRGRRQLEPRPRRQALHPHRGAQLPQGPLPTSSPGDPRCRGPHARLQVARQRQRNAVARVTPVWVELRACRMARSSGAPLLSPIFAAAGEAARQGVYRRGGARPAGPPGVSFHMYMYINIL